MIGLVVKTNNDFVGVKRLSKKQTKVALYRSAGYVRKVAKSSIKMPGKKVRQASAARARKLGLSRDQVIDAYYPPSPPGTPPHTHTKQLPRSIAFAANVRAGSYVIGPKRSGISEIGKVHEFGGKFRGRNYPARPFMRPALARSERVVVENFKGMFKQSYQGGPE